MRPRSVVELIQEAQITEPADNYTLKQWCASASLLRRNASLEKNPETAFVLYLKQSTIVIDIIPKLKDFHADFIPYRELRGDIIKQIDEMETLKPIISSRHEEWKRARAEIKIDIKSEKFESPLSAVQLDNIGNQHISSSPLSNIIPTISPRELYDIIKTPSPFTILIFDVRLKEEYISGHIKWYSPNGVQSGGIINLEPDFIKKISTKLSSEDLIEAITAFGQETSSIYLNLFRKRDEFDLVVFHDQKSQMLTTELKRLNDVLVKSRFPALKKPLFLIGGFEAWELFLSRGGISSRDYLDIGDGPGITDELPKLIQKIASGEQAINTLPSLQIKSDNLASRPSNYASKKNITPIEASFEPQMGFQMMSYGTVDARVLSAKESYPELPQINQYTDVSMRYSINDGKTVNNTQDYANAPKTDRKTHLSANRNNNRDVNQIQFSQSQNLNALYPEQGLTSSQYNPEKYEHITDGYKQNTRQRYEPSNYSDQKSSQNFMRESLTGTSQNSVQQQAPIMKQQIDKHRQSSPKSSNLRNQIPTTPPKALENRVDSIQSSLYRPSTTPLSRNILTDTLPIQKVSIYPAISSRTTSLNSSSEDVSRPKPFPRAPSLTTIHSAVTPQIINQYYARQPPNYQTPSHSRSSTSEISVFGASKYGLVGLKNLGNTCFMNSIIQCLNATVPLSRYFYTGGFRRHINKNNKLGSGGKIVEAYAALLKNMWSDRDPVVSPGKFKELIGTKAPQFQGYDQQDSQEFLAFLLDMLHEDINVARGEPQTSEDDNDTIPDHIAAERSWTNYTNKNWSVIVDMFQGQLKSKLQCLTCHTTSTTYNPFMYLSLPIPSSSSWLFIENCLDKFIEVEILDGNDQWHCPKCKVPRRASKQLTISKLPQCLLIHFKRFYFQGPFRNKIDTYIEFPTNAMDLSGYVPSRLLQAQQNNGFIYDLYAISNHYGGLSGGHYTAQVKNVYDGSWQNLDDTRISPVGNNPEKTKAAYILFYNRRNTPETAQLVNWWADGHI